MLRPPAGEPWVCEPLLVFETEPSRSFDWFSCASFRPVFDVCVIPAFVFGPLLPSLFWFCVTFDVVAVAVSASDWCTSAPLLPESLVCVTETCWLPFWV